MSATATLRPGNAGPQKKQEVVGLETGKNSEGHQHARRRSTSLDAAERLSLYISVSSTLHFSCITPSLSGGGGRYGTDGTHCEHGVMPCGENACGLGDRMPRILDAGAKEARISDNPLRIPPLFCHYPVTIWSQLSDSPCITTWSRHLQTPSNSTVYARSPVKSGFQRSLRKSRTILPVALQNFSTILPASFYWSFYWRSPFVFIIIGYMLWSFIR